MSAVGFGCWALGGEGWGEDVDDAEAVGAVGAALDRGITLFDTAPIYGRGVADERLRRGLGARRHDVVIATKVGPRFEGDHPKSDLSPENVRRDVEASLERLGLDVLPLVQTHWACERGTPLEATLEALHRLVDEGKIRHVGLCNVGPEALGVGAVDTLQTPLSLVRQDYLHDGLSNAAADHGLAVLAYEPLCRGLLSGKFRTLPRFARGDVRRDDPRFWAARFAHLTPRVARLSKLAERLSTTAATLAVAWAATRPNVVSALVGAKRPAQIEETAGAIELLERDGATEVLGAVGRAV